MLNNLFVVKKIKENIGTYEWLLVRCSAILIFFYIIYLLSFVFSTNILTYEMWYTFFSKTTTRIFNFITLLSILTHSWIGISHILADYIKNPLFKHIMKFIIFSIFCIYLFCGMNVIWGI